MHYLRRFGTFLPPDTYPLPDSARLNLKLWLDANDRSTITHDESVSPTEGKVSRWDDKSGNGNNATQGTGSKQPTTGSATQNGKNVLDLDGGDILVLPSALHTIPNGPNTAFVVVKRDSEDATVDAFLVMEEGASTRYLFTYNAAAGDASFRSNASGSGGKTITGGTNTDFQIFSGRREGTTQAIARNGSAEVTNASGADEPNIDGAFIGGAEIALFLNGQIAEVLMYDKSLTAPERRSVFNYLSPKWRITLV